MSQSEGVRLGNTRIDEEQLLRDVAELREAIEAWAKRRRLWHDAAFQVPFLFRRESPRRGEVLLFFYEGPLFQVFNSPEYLESEKYENQFSALLQDRGFEYWLNDHVSLTIAPVDKQRKDAFLSLYRWQWIQQLATKRLFDIHSEVFEHFAGCPDDLKKLTWRQYEEFLDAVFRNQGFRTELGSGTNDDGIDIRLYQSNAIPQLVTLVQAKRYTQRPISLDPVAALCGVATQQRASRGILVTTSRFQPKAQRFALTTEQRVDMPTIELVDSGRVSDWCADIAKGLNSFFSNGHLNAPPIIARPPASDMIGKIVVAHGGYNMSDNYFCVVEAEFPHEVILRPIGTRVIQGNLAKGVEVPVDGERYTWSSKHRFVAFKQGADASGNRQFWGERKLFSVWNGKPQGFDNYD